MSYHSELMNWRKMEGKFESLETLHEPFSLEELAPRDHSELKMAPRRALMD
jgi:hypothetical protein